jgi:hypothetical protein
MAGSLLVAPAAHAAIDQTAMDNAVFSAYMRASAKSEQDFVMHVAWSAELLDWRAKNGQANRDAMYAHRLVIGRHFHENNTVALEDLGAHEMLGIVLDDLSRAPGAEFRGTAVKALVNTLTGRDATRMSPKIEDRLTASEQYFSGERRYSDAPSLVWSEVANLARRDPDFKEVWDSEFGAAHQWVSATDNAGILEKTPLLNEYFDLPPILAKQNDPVAVKQLVIDQVAALGRQVNVQQAAIFTGIKTAAAKNVPGDAPKPQDEVPVETAEAKQKDRQEVIDGVQAGFDGLSYIALALGQDAFSKQIKTIGDGAAKFATASNKLLAFMETAGKVSGFATAAAMGNFVGAAIAMLSLFSPGGPSIDQVILDQIAKLREDIKRLGSEMGGRFDRVDSKLTDVYNKLVSEFDRTNGRIDEVRRIATDIAANLLEQQAKLQAIGSALLEAMADLSQDNLLSSANLAVDYASAHQGAKLPEADFITAENTFNYFGTQAASNASFVVPESSYTLADNDVSTLLNLYGPPGKSFGPTGSIRFLAWYARNSGLDPEFPVPGSGKVANPAVWTLAANAYTLMTDQNRDTAATAIDRWRADDVIKVGQDIQDALSSFIYSGQIEPGKASRLYRNLMARYRTSVTALLNNLAEQERLTRDNKVYELFGNYEQGAPAGHGIPVPAQMRHCSGLPEMPAVKTADNANGIDLSPAVMFARYAYETPPVYNPCYSAIWVNQREKVDVVWPFYRTTKTADLQIIVDQTVIWPAGSGTQARTARKVAAVVKKDVVTQVCLRDEPEGPRTCSPIEELGANEEAAKGWEPELRTAFQKSGQVVPGDYITQSDNLAKLHTEKFMNMRKGQYYKRVADAVDLGLARDVDFSVQLLRAYSEVGLSRALESDDQLKALLYGQRPVYTAPLLGQLFRRAANNYAAGTPDPFAGQTQLETAGSQFPPPPGLTSKDRFSAWIAYSMHQRTDRLSVRLDKPFEYFDNQSLPEVRMAMTKLKLVTDAIHGTG